MVNGADRASGEFRDVLADRQREKRPTLNSQRPTSNGCDAEGVGRNWPVFSISLRSIPFPSFFLILQQLGVHQLV